jgi:lipopolysaccharide/colanic/teichoic acid biosynthesis glycosyltransferase
MNKCGLYEKYLKRPIDIIISLVAIVLLSPLFIIITLLVRLRLGSPIIFKQDRPGKNEKIFTMYKFRTMIDGNHLSDEKRHTKFGRILRSLSLDELPGLLNVIKGDMSLVGPRPLLVEYLNFYSLEHKKRHSVRPGLTGLAQINGRNTISWKEKFDYDIEYVNKITFLKDFKIIFKTIFKVLKREGVNMNQNITMEKFNGRN